MNNNLYKVCVIGLGYVGLPLAIEFGKKIKTIGFDISKLKIKDLKNKLDRDKIINKLDFKKSKYLNFSHNLNDLNKTNIFIICLPTPVNNKNLPDLSILKSGTKIVAKNLKKNSIVIYESSVYPTVTENICLPILKKYSNLEYKKDFNIGYSPERINPGDKNHTLTKITKVVSGDTKTTAVIIKKLYQLIIKKVYVAKSILVAESSKIIENTQRDLNIALMNELSIIFNKMGINTKDVLNAASTKWNFVNFKPGLVGGHCIGVDPYYLSYFSKKIGHEPKVISAGRNLNNNMTKYVLTNILLFLKKKNILLSESKIIFLGLTFKKNCTDIRNSKIIEIINFLIKKKSKVQMHDPLVDKEILKRNKLQSVNWKKLKNNSDIIVIFSYHDEFKKISISEMRNKISKNGIIFDIMSELDDRQIKDLRRNVWQL
jgi:UDP-N-acetyl-D-galactosamine dehydrogenase